MGQIRCLTVPELRDLARRHQLDSSGKKAQLLMRLSVWVRDEVAIGTAACETAAADSSIDEEDGAKHAESARTKSKDDESLFSSDRDHDGEADEEDGAKHAESARTKSKDDESLSSSDHDGEDDEDSDSSSDEELELIGDTRAAFPFLRAQGPNSGCGVENANDNDDDDCSSEEDDDSADKRRAPVVSSRRTEPESPMHATLRKLFGHSNFREGQEWAIDRCLNKKRSLLVAPTGFGKSLCFTLPAAMMDGVCIVVSPLLSLIQDQIRVLPARLPAVTLSGPMSTASMAATLDDIVRGRIKVLFVSPERLTSSSFRRLFRQRWDQETKEYKRMFPTVSLFCIDEAHCLSQWAHNFRPSYLRLRSMMEMIEPQSVLAVTATAGPRVVSDICRTLQIEHDGSFLASSLQDQQATTQIETNEKASPGIRISKTDRDNIDVSCLLLDTQEQRLSKVRHIGLDLDQSLNLVVFLSRPSDTSTSLIFHFAAYEDTQQNAAAKDRETTKAV